ncbi:TBC1 domain family member 31 [Sitophilus oryzae]|uniref:TBC1 domain family member 31 n=1 Tax=Sitophilus oryzae TaxID=7048 RepID=A0A6J2YQI2_SITOR|nr:TBC1 domain family member 31 [Sitophilus oryzae]
MDKIDTSKNIKSEITKYYLNLKQSNSEGLLLTIQDTSGRKGLRFVYSDIHVNGCVLALANTESQIYLIDFRTKRYWLLKKLDSCTCIKLADCNEGEIFVGKNNGVLEILDIDTGNVKEKLHGHEHPAISISFSQTNICLSASKYEALIWDLITYSKLQVLSLEENCILKFVHFIPISNNILVCYQDDIIQIWDTNNLNSLKQFLPSNWRNYCVKAISFSKNGKIMVVSGYLPILAIFQLDIWKLLKIVNLPNYINTVKKIGFISQNFDGGNNKLLAILSGNGIIYFYNIEDNILISKLVSKFEIYNYNIASSNTQYLSCLLCTGDVEIYDINTFILKNEKTVVENAEFSSRVSRKKSLRILNKKVGILEKQKIHSILETEKLKGIIKEYDEFPEIHRYTIWEKILKLPNNTKQYNNLVDHITITSFDELYQKFYLEDKVTMQCLKHVLNNIVTWCPFFAQVDYLPFFLFPFIKVFHKKPIACFELCCTLIINWCQHWFEYHPLPPLNILAVIDNILMEHDALLLQHFSSYKISPNIYSWIILESAFSEVLTAPQWLKFWDHVFINEPAFLLCAVAAYNILQRKNLILIHQEQLFYDFFHRQTPIDVKKLISKSYNILNNTSNTNHPRQYLNMFTCLTCGKYPIFDQYPKEVVDFQSEHISYLQGQLEEIKKLKENTLKDKNRQDNILKDTIRIEEERRWIDMEKACIQKIKDYQEALKIQQQELKEMRSQLYNKEKEIIDNAHKDFKQHTSAKNAGTMEILLDGLDLSKKLNESEIEKIRDLYNEKYMNLLWKEQNLEKFLHSEQPHAEFGNELYSAHIDTMAVKDKIHKTKSEVKMPGKADLYLTITALNNLIGKIKRQLEKEYQNSNYVSENENTMVQQLERETKSLEKEISQLLSLLGRKNKTNYKCKENCKSVRFTSD